MKTVLFGPEADSLAEEVAKHPELTLVDDGADVIICYGGDGTLLTSENRWPGVPKVPIKNSRHGIRCLPHPPEKVLERLAAGQLVRTEYMKLQGQVRFNSENEPPRELTAVNEFNVHMGLINSAVRFRLWVDGEAYGEDTEIVGDGFVMSTPFGSTAYFNHITGGAFYAGIGIAFKSSTERTSHVIVPEASVCRVVITRGPATLAFDNSTDYIGLTQGDELTVRRHGQPAVLLTWRPMSHPSDEF